ncbi:MAG: flagellar hook capping FlgD N-terminal domain-containing protein [Verrucomicrobiota bacterium]
MSVTSVDPYASINNNPANSTTQAASSNSTLNFNDLLSIIVTQLSQQDPSKAASTTDLVNQYMSMANLQSSTTLKSNSDAEVSQARQSFAANLIGKKVNVLDSNGNTVTGAVDQSRVSGTSVILSINGIDYDSASIQNYLQ